MFGTLNVMVLDCNWKDLVVGIDQLDQNLVLSGPQADCVDRAIMAQRDLFAIARPNEVISNVDFQVFGFRQSRRRRFDS